MAWSREGHQGKEALDRASERRRRPAPWRRRLWEVPPRGMGGSACSSGHGCVSSLLQRRKSFWRWKRDNTLTRRARASWRTCSGSESVPGLAANGWSPHVDGAWSADSGKPQPRALEERGGGESHDPLKSGGAEGSHCWPPRALLPRRLSILEQHSRVLLPSTELLSGSRGQFSFRVHASCLEPDFGALQVATPLACL